MSAYDFRGRGKRNRAAFKEADDEVNTCIRFAGGLFRGALRDVTNAARRREAAPTAASDVGLEASVEDNAPEDGGDVAVEASAASDAPKDGGDVAVEASAASDAPKDGGDVGLEASAASDAPKDGGDVAVEASAASDAPEKAAACGGATTTTSLALKYVERAHGGGVGGAPVAVEVFNAPLCAAIMNDETVRGVDFKSIVSEIHSRVSPSALSRDAFARWLARGAPMFAATGVPNLDMHDDGDCRQREFRRREFRWLSPLDSSESFFACEQFNACAVAAKALDASDDELRQALEEVETAKGANMRYYNCRGCYHYRIRTDDGRVFAYVGESVDVERRVNEHVTALLDDGRDKIQRGHALVRHARKGDDDVDDDNDFNFRAWIINWHDEASAVELAKTYVETCGEKSPSILEVARAIAGAGFFAEAVWTAHYGTLHGHTTGDGVIGMNFSQPGVCHPQGRGVDATDATWEQMKAKFGKTTTRSGGKQPAFTCGECSREIVQGKKSYARGGDGAKRICGSCYKKALYAKQPAFTCGECSREIVQGKKSHPHGDGRVCKACYESYAKGFRNTR